ncbi:MAG: hypothetical protein HOK63_06840 [Thaumarchaeota archaeon]|jgi:hypothetical protein|nr:hypothetical protein [Nitrososphaerota archaeon]MBT5843192.1 hypothetical protein [Nitrososphaerota archaeon]MBT6469343.1 hypothetical protein [Nitrososphaerota archaeon]
MSERKPFRRFKKREPSLTAEEKIKQFVLRNSDNGYFTKVSTLTYKFEIPESRVWDIVGEFLADGTLESTHDQNTGDMKLCKTGKTYAIMDNEKKRKYEKYKTNSKSNKPKFAKSKPKQQKS